MARYKPTGNKLETKQPKLSRSTPPWTSTGTTYDPTAKSRYRRLHVSLERTKFLRSTGNIHSCNKNSRWEDCHGQSDEATTEMHRIQEHTNARSEYDKAKELGEKETRKSRADTLDRSPWIARCTRSSISPCNDGNGKIPYQACEPHAEPHLTMEGSAEITLLKGRKYVVH